MARTTGSAGRGVRPERRPVELARVLPLAAACLMPVVVAGLYALARGGAGPPDAGASPEVALRQGDVVLTGLSMVGGAEGGASSSLHADAVRIGKRTSLGGLLVYHDLRDLFVSGAALRLRPAAPDPEAAPPPFDLLGALSQQLGPILGAARPRGAAGGGREGLGLSRVRFDGLSVVAELGDGRILSIAARRARIDPRFETLALRESVTITDAEGVERRAAEAVWSREFAGIYFPEGYWIRDRRREGEAFFGVSDDGRLARRRPIPRVAYRDEIEEMEARIGAAVLGDALPGLRAALGIPPSP
jgi:hypothetical protein